MTAEQEPKLYNIRLNGKHWGTAYGTSAEDVLRSVNERLGNMKAADTKIEVSLRKD